MWDVVTLPPMQAQEKEVSAADDSVTNQQASSYKESTEKPLGIYKVHKPPMLIPFLLTLLYMQASNCTPFHRCFRLHAMHPAPTRGSAASQSTIASCMCTPLAAAKLGPRHPL